MSSTSQRRVATNRKLAAAMKEEEEEGIMVDTLMRGNSSVLRILDQGIKLKCLRHNSNAALQHSYLDMSVRACFDFSH